ncbi:unnamed protein product [Camellia sinensis]
MTWRTATTSMKKKLTNLNCERAVNTPIHTIMMWTVLILMFILDMSIHILLNMHFLKRSFCWFIRFGVVIYLKVAVHKLLVEVIVHEPLDVKFRSLLLYHHHKNNKKLKDGNDDDDKIQHQSLNEKNESVSEMSSQGKVLEEGPEKKNQPKSIWKERNCSGARKDNISDAPNGSTHHIKSVVKKELSQSPSNLVFGYLKLFYDGVFFPPLWISWWGGQELCFCLHMSFLKRIHGRLVMYIAVAKVLAEMNNGSSSAIKSI